MVRWLLFVLLIPAVSTANHGSQSCHQFFAIPKSVQGEERFYKPPDFYFYRDDTYGFQFEATRSLDGIVSLEAYLEMPLKKLRSVYRGKDLYRDMMLHFGPERVQGVLAIWVGGTNLKQFNDRRSQGDSLEKAALNTWSGQMAQAWGLTEVTVVNRTVAQQIPTQEVEVIFRRKH